METKTVKTITLKEVIGEIPRGGGDFIGRAVMAFTGKADKYFTKITQYGESVCLVGDFVAINLLTGEVVEGSQIYLPDELAQSVAKALDTKGDGSAVIFDSPVEILVAASERGARGYTFVTRGLSTPEAVKERENRAEKLRGAVAALAITQDKAKQVENKGKAKSA